MKTARRPPRPGGRRAVTFREVPRPRPGAGTGGIAGEAPTFPNARYVAGAAEFDHWTKAGNEGFDTKVKPLAEKMTMIDDGATVAPGITAMAAVGPVIASASAQPKRRASASS